MPEATRYLEMNEPRPTEQKDVTPEEDTKTRTLCNKLYDEAKKGREPYVKEFKEYRKFYIGEHWSTKRPSYRASPVINLIFSNLRLILPLLTDSRPQVVPIPTEPTDQDFANILKEVIDYKWTQFGWDQELEDALFDTLLLGTGFWRVEWNPDLENGLGDILIEAVDAMSCYPDPNAEDINSPNSRYFIYDEPVSLGEAKRQYPDYADKFGSADYLKATPSGDLESRYTKSPVNTGLVLEMSGYEGSEITNQIIKRHFWLKDTTTEECELEKGDGTTETVQKMKYPNGRYIVYIGNAKVEDRENPYEDGRFPFCKMQNYPLPREFWGMSEVKQLKQPQIIINKMLAYVLDNINLMGNATWIIDSAAGVDPELITNQPGLKIVKNANTEVRRDGGAPMPPQVFGLLDRALKLFDTVGGVGPEVRGRFEGGITSGYMLQSLQEAAQVPIRAKERSMQRFLTQAGQMIVSRIMQFFTAPRIVRITGTSSGIPQYFQFYMMTDQNGQKVAKYAEIQQDGTQQLPQEIPVKGMPDVKITTGTSMPFAKAQKAEMALQLQKMNDIDREEVLKAVQWPNWQDVNNRMEEKEQAQAQAEQQAEMQEQAAKGEGNAGG